MFPINLSLIILENRAAFISWLPYIPLGVTLRSESEDLRQISPTVAGTIVVAVEAVEVDALSALVVAEMPLFEGLGVNLRRLLLTGEAKRFKLGLLPSTVVGMLDGPLLAAAPVEQGCCWSSELDLITRGGCCCRMANGASNDDSLLLLLWLVLLEIFTD